MSHLKLYPRILVITLCALALLVELWVVKYYNDKKAIADMVPNDNGIILRNTDEIIESMRESSISNVAIDIIQRKGIKGVIASKDLANLIVEGHSKFLYPAGVDYQVDENGLLAEASGGRKYKVYSNGVSVIVAPQTGGKPLVAPILTDGN